MLDEDGCDDDVQAEVADRGTIFSHPALDFSELVPCQSPHSAGAASDTPVTRPLSKLESNPALECSTVLSVKNNLSRKSSRRRVLKLSEYELLPTTVV